jgi:hypothetical protein
MNRNSATIVGVILILSVLSIIVNKSNFTLMTINFTGSIDSDIPRTTKEEGNQNNKS